MLFCVLVSGGQNNSFWGRESAPSATDGWTVWEAESLEKLEAEIWLARSEAASMYDCLDYMHCHKCGWSGDKEECPECGSSTLENDEAWAEHVENNSYAEFVTYNPKNSEHALCPNGNTTIDRPEHLEAIEKRDHLRRLAKRNMLQIKAQSIREEIAELEKIWEETIWELDNYV